MCIVGMDVHDRTPRILFSHPENVSPCDTHTRRLKSFRSNSVVNKVLLSHRTSFWVLITLANKTGSIVLICLENCRNFSLCLVCLFCLFISIFSRVQTQIAQVEEFAFPDKSTVQPCTQLQSEAYSFVMTREDGSRYFGFCRRCLVRVSCFFFLTIRNLHFVVFSLCDISSHDALGVVLVRQKFLSPLVFKIFSCPNWRKSAFSCVDRCFSCLRISPSIGRIYRRSYADNAH